MPQFNQLLDKYLCNELNEEELRLFLEAARQPENLEALRKQVMLQLQENKSNRLTDSSDINLMFEQMLHKVSDIEPVVQPALVVPSFGRKRRFIVSIAAACTLLLLSTGAYLWFNYKKQFRPVAQKQPAVQQDIAPGGDRATLTLSDGTTIDLNNAAEGVLANQGNASVIKNGNGELQYQPVGKQPSTALYNSISTPRGGQYKLVLPDGTKVWLNASTAVRYPAVFNTTERRVSMDGEAYFEVAHKKDQPFIVEANGMQVQVTGTHFNVNAYADEAAVRTTLLEGSVNVKKGMQQATLQPGQQVEVGAEGLGKAKTIDVEEVVAWKNGLFSFNGDDLAGIMRQLARWYNIEVRYEGAVPKRLFAGQVFRNMKLSETLKVLELSGIRFRVEGGTLIVIP